jgi:hypothetical protein
MSEKEGNLDRIFSQAEDNLTGVRSIKPCSKLSMEEVSRPLILPLVFAKCRKISREMKATRKALVATNNESDH